MTLVAYSPLLSGGYVREDRPLGPEFDHAGTERRLSALRAVAAETGATLNQVVLAWMMGGELPVIPLVGASSVAQLEDSLGAVDLELSPEQRARGLAAASGLPGYEVLQYCHTYLRQRADSPSWLSPDGEPGAAGPDLLSYLRSTGLPLVAYSPLLSGAYVRPDRPLGPEFDHAGTPRRLAALSAVASETGATPNQVVLAWLMGGELPVIPLVGASSVAQLEESLGAVDLTLTTEQRERLDQAG